MRVARGLTGKITHQQCIIQIDILRYRHPHGVTIAWRNWHRFAFGVFHLLKGKVDVALRGHQLQAVANGEFVFDQYGCQLAFTLASEFADKLLALRNRESVFIVLIVVMRMAAQEPFGVTAMRQALQRFQQLRVERFTGSGIINGFAINLRGTCAVIV